MQNFKITPYQIALLQRTSTPVTRSVHNVKYFCYISWRKKIRFEKYQKVSQLKDLKNQFEAEDLILTGEWFNRIEKQQYIRRRMANIHQKIALLEECT